MDDVLKSIKQQNTYRNLTIAAATLSNLVAVPGQLHAISLGMVSCPTLTLYDNASGASGTILALIEAGATPGNYIYDTSFLVGLSAWVTQTGKVPIINISVR